MQLALAPLSQQLNFELEVVDIEGEDELEREFGDYVPVLKLGKDKICHYVLDESALRLALERARSARLNPST
jgi:hypothetical protein